MTNRYDFKKIERKWQKGWLEEKVFKASDKPLRQTQGKPKYYQLETFPYPSAAGLHVGHPKGYIAEDIHARFMRMNGREVLYTMGWDAFGLPTENYAIKVGKSPQEVATENIKNFKRQLQMFGFSYDWDREINTSSPEYYKWTQWLFIQLYKKGLAYKKKATVNWCPGCLTVLANEQVVTKGQGSGVRGQEKTIGVCERCETPVEQREMEQWFLRITDYAERLLDDLNFRHPESSHGGTKDLAGNVVDGISRQTRNDAGIDWPEASIKRQKDWIGKSEGASIRFYLKNIPGQEDGKYFVEVFTTWPDTLFGATYMVLAPEHPLIKNLEFRIENLGEVKKYIEQTRHKTELQRQEETKEKTGVELRGIKAINPATKEEIPVWIADYVLASYGTGAIMAVPAHDERDYEFAIRHNLPIKEVVSPRINAPARQSLGVGGDLNADKRGYISENKLGSAYVGNGALVNSGKFDGMDSETAKWEITKFVGGEKKVQYRLRDWSVSRQRYWGVPIPMVYCEKCGVVPVPEKDLPVKLPSLKDYRPKGVPPLASSEKFINVKCPQCGGEAKRDAETLDTFVDSSWYFLRYTDPRNDKEFASKEKLDYWLGCPLAQPKPGCGGVDLYVIGAEHTTLHLLYARFISKFLHDIGYLNFAEPFLKLRHQGLILGADGQKMSKSKGNVVNPDELIEEFGADTVRLYEMFMGPFEQGQPWDLKGVLGVHRFLNRAWNLFSNIRTSDVLSIGDSHSEPFGKIQGKLREESREIATPRPEGVGARNDEKILTLLHKTIKKITEDIENFRFNTAVSALMILLNEMERVESSVISHQSFVKLLHPFAPHIAQELWSQLGNETYLDFEPWPEYDPELIKEDKITIVVQVNGKVRDSFETDAGIEEAEARELALGREKIKNFIVGKEPNGSTPLTIKKIIYVPDKLVNIVI